MLIFITHIVTPPKCTDPPKIVIHPPKIYITNTHVMPYSLYCREIVPLSNIEMIVKRSRHDKESRMASALVSILVLMFEHVVQWCHTFKVLAYFGWTKISLIYTTVGVFRMPNVSKGILILMCLSAHCNSDSVIFCLTLIYASSSNINS